MIWDSVIYCIMVIAEKLGDNVYVAWNWSEKSLVEQCD